MFCCYLSQYLIKEQLGARAQSEGLRGRKREGLHGRKREGVERGTLKNRTSYFQYEPSSS